MRTNPRARPSPKVSPTSLKVLVQQEGRLLKVVKVLHLPTPNVAI
jgi:hypothetical protein